MNQALLNEVPAPLAAARPVLADKAWIFNGYSEMSLTYLGRYTYRLPYGEMVEVGPLVNHREIDETATMQHRGPHNPYGVAWKTIPLQGEYIARELLTLAGRNLGKRGIFVTTNVNDPELPARRAEALEMGRRTAIQAIEAFKVSRRERDAGSGGKFKPDARVWNWMKEYAPDDEFFGGKSKQTEANTLMATAVDKIAQLIERMGTAPGAKAPGPNDPPVKKNFEKDEDYKKRVAAWALGPQKE